MMSDELPDSDTRRQLLAATAGAVGIGAIAGCVEGEDGGGDGEDSGPTRPTPDNINTDQLDPVLTFMVRSHHYQNQMLEQEYGGG